MLGFWVNVFNRVFKGKNLQLRSMLEKITTVRHIHRKYGNKITDRSICFDQHVSGLVKVGGGGGGTYIYILTYRIKNDIRINLFIRINKFR